MLNNNTLIDYCKKAGVDEEKLSGFLGIPVSRSRALLEEDEVLFSTEADKIKALFFLVDDWPAGTDNKEDGDSTVSKESCKLAEKTAELLKERNYTGEELEVIATINQVALNSFELKRIRRELEKAGILENKEDD